MGSKEDFEYTLKKIDNAFAEIRKAMQDLKIKEERLVKETEDFESISNSKHYESRTAALTYLQRLVSKMASGLEANSGTYSKIDSIAELAELNINELKKYIK